MSAELILIRHGNTFAQGDKVLWCGARTDLPLVAAGRAQAETLGHQIQIAGLEPAQIIAGPLLRTHQHADIIAELTDFPGEININEDLREIDYGDWEGLSTEEIIALGGGAALAAWNDHAVWPEGPGWSPTEAALEDMARSFLAQISSTQSPTLLVTSNGILRFFARAAINPPKLDGLKVRTGGWGKMVPNDAGWRITHWNGAPDAFA